jgi:hypothetical protein
VRSTFFIFFDWSLETLDREVRLAISVARKYAEMIGGTSNEKAVFNT